MSDAAIVTQLKCEREELEKQCRGAKVRIAQLTVAIDALEGRTAVAAVSDVESPSVAKLLEGTLAGFPAGKVFDHKSLVEELTRTNPGQAGKIKTGIYSAVTSLKKKGVIKLAPGGFTI